MNNVIIMSAGASVGAAAVSAAVAADDAARHARQVAECNDGDLATCQQLVNGYEHPVAAGPILLGILIAFGVMLLIAWLLEREW